jgi:hypothetical protein
MMVAVAHHYLGSNETGGSFVVTDIGDNGRPLRSSRVDLMFVGARRDTITKGQNELMAAIQSQSLTFSGRFPHEYSASRRIEQWSPEMLRTFSLSPDAIPALPVDWNDASLVMTAAGRAKLKTELIGSSHVECIRASVFHEAAGFDVLHGHVSALVSRQDSMAYPPYLNIHGGYTWSQMLHDLVDTCSRSSPQGFFHYVGQVSPGGAAMMEDLPILDIGNPDQWLLVILLKTDDGYHLIRRLYCVAGSE